MRTFLLFMLVSVLSIKSVKSQSNDYSINFNSPDKQKYLTIGMISSAVGYKMYHDHYKLIDPKTAHKKAFIASTLTTLSLGLLKESLDFSQSGYNWNSDDYGKDLITAMMGGCAITITFSLFQ